MNWKVFAAGMLSGYPVVWFLIWKGWWPMAKSGLSYTAADCPVCGGVGMNHGWRDGRMVHFPGDPCENCDGTGRVPVKLAGARRPYSRWSIAFVVALFVAAAAVVAAEIWWRKP